MAPKIRRAERRLRAVELVEKGKLTHEQAARAFEVTRQSIAMWLRQYRERGAAGLADSKTPRGRTLKLDEATAREIVEDARAAGGSTLDDLVAAAARRRVKVGRSSIHRAVVHYGLWPLPAPSRRPSGRK